MKKSATLNQYFDSKKQFLQGFVNDRDKLRSLLNRSKELQNLDPVEKKLKTQERAEERPLKILKSKMEANKKIEKIESKKNLEKI